eukprot:scaffold10813_cov65-Phaeocystis_antarctica.AAC.3
MRLVATRLVDRLVVVSGEWPHPNPAPRVAKLAVVGSEVWWVLGVRGGAGVRRVRRGPADLDR